jgi:hypothetical protein
MAERSIAVELDEGVVLGVVAEQSGPQLVSDKDLTAKLSSVTRSIEVVSREAMEAVKKATPDRATVEVGFGLAIEQGQLVALLGKGKAEATITVTLEWARGDGTE